MSATCSTNGFNPTWCGCPATPVPQFFNQCNQPGATYNVPSTATSTNTPGACSIYTFFTQDEILCYASLAMGGPGEWDCQEDPSIPSAYVANQINCLQAIPLLPTPACQNNQGCQISDLALSYNTVTCTRTAFTGDPSQCCMQDYQCTGAISSNSLINQSCFTGGNNSQTCPPQFRSVSQPLCFPFTNSFCLGQDLAPTDPTWLERWQTSSQSATLPPCQQFLYRQLFGDTVNCIVDPTTLKGANIQAPGFDNGIALMTQVFEKYAAQGFTLGAIPGATGYDPAQETFRQICLAFPGLCKQGLLTRCQAETANSISRDPGSAPFCGCYLPQSEYEIYQNLYQIPPQCTPTCAKVNTIPLVEDDLITVRPCTESSCLIDQININLVSSNVNGDINFVQLCSNCGPGSTCTCIIANNTISAAQSQISDINITEICGSGTVCYLNNPVEGASPPFLEIPCDVQITPSNNPFEQEITARQQALNDFFIRVTVGIFLVILVLIIFYVATR